MIFCILFLSLTLSGSKSKCTYYTQTEENFLKQAIFRFGGNPTNIPIYDIFFLFLRALFSVSIFASIFKLNDMQSQIKVKHA